MLTQQQQAHFETFGFVAIRQLFQPDEVEVIIREFEDAMLADRGGKPFDGLTRQSIGDWFMGRPAVEFLIDDQRIRGPIEQLLGPGYTFGKGNDGNFYVGDTLWHPDMGWDPHIPEGRTDRYRVDGPMWNHYVPSIKVGFYLDPVGRDTGCLRVIPGSHRSPYHERFWSLHSDIPKCVETFESSRPKLLEMWERDTGGREGWDRLASDPKTNHFGLEPSDIPSYAIESRPGDALFFSHQIWHSSFGGHSGRRMFTLNFRSAQADGSGRTQS